MSNFEMAGLLATEPIYSAMNSRDSDHCLIAVSLQAESRMDQRSGTAQKNTPAPGRMPVQKVILSFCPFTG
jgi:hypothetical protein